MKRFRLLFVMVFAIFMILPFKVNAELNGADSMNTWLDDIVYGGVPQTTAYLSANHLQSGKETVNLIWYESTDKSNYTLMDSNDTYDYNTYYKVIFDTSFTQINSDMDEGWEVNSIYLEIFNPETQAKVDNKTLTSSDSTLEYVFDPIWKYNVKYNITGVTYEGQTEVVEGDPLMVSLTPMEGYRLPTSVEITSNWEYIFKVTSYYGNIPFEYYGQYLTIEPENINGDIQIDIDGIPARKLIIDANGGTINGKSQYVIEDYDNNPDFPEPTREGYYLKGWYTKPVGGIYIDADDQIKHGMTLYAHWDKEGIVSIDFANMEYTADAPDIEDKWLDYLEDIGIIIFDSDTNSVKNKDGKVLMTIDADDKMKITNGLTVADNIIHNLTPEEKELLRQKGETDIPDRIEVIFSTKQVVKIIFDAKGGVFKNNITTIDIEDIINFDYDTFEKPTRKGYKFIGFYTEKDKSYLDVMNSEAGVEEDTTFYAKWELDEEVPKTLDNITSSMIMGTISLIGLVGATIYFRKRNKVRA